MGKFRKSCAFLCLATFSLGFGLMGCNKSNDKETPAEQTFTITFDSQGGSAVAAQTVKYGEKATKPSDPTKENFIFDAWYEDSAAVTKFDFDLAITADWTLYAGWLAGGSGGEGGETPVTPDPEEAELYFRDASWWNKDAAATHYAFDGEESYGQMEHIVYDSDNHYNYWKVVIPEGATKVVFARYGTDSNTHETSYWGAKTVEITLADRGEHNMYDISATSEAWENNNQFVTGVWATYDPSTQPEPSPEPGEGYTLNVEIASSFDTQYHDGGAKTFIYAFNDSAKAWLNAEDGSVVIAEQYTKFIVVRMNPAYASNPGWEGKWDQSDDIQIETEKTTVTVTNFAGTGKLHVSYL